MEKLVLKAEERPLVFCLRHPGGAVVTRGIRDEVMEEEVEGEDGARETKNGQSQELEPGETTRLLQDIIELHGEEMEVQVFKTGQAEL